MLQIIRILSFYIILPLMSLWWLFFTVGLTFTGFTINKWRGTIGVLSGLLFSTAIIILDLVFRKSAQSSAVTSDFSNILAYLFTFFLIGFFAFFLIDRLTKNDFWQLAIFFTTAGGIISLYFLVTLAGFRDISSLSILGFAFGWSICSLIFTNVSLSPFSIIISIFSPMHSMMSDGETNKKVIDSTFVQSQRINISVEVAKIDGDVVGIQIIGSSGGSKPVSNNKVDEVYMDLKQILTEIGKKYFKISVGHPKLISKGYESPFVVQLYFEELTNSVKMKIKEVVGESFTERVYDTELKFGQVVKIKLFSPDVIFPEAIAKKLDSSVNAMTFLGKPLDTCQPREHKVVLSIMDNETGIEYQSETFPIKVADYAFDHVPRPLLSKVSAFVLGIGSFTMFILALLEQIDKTVGLTSGTAAGVLAVVIYTNFYNLYQRIRSNTP